jgi:hypothetical protein
MTDIREAILARMLVIAEDVEDVELAARNKLTLDESQRPAIIILDGPETARNNEASRRPARAPRIIDMQPSVVVMVGAKAEDVGTLINLYRARYLKALTEDTEFLELTHDSEGFRYDGCTPTVEEGRVVEGQMEFHLSITYILQPFGL